MNDLKLTYKGVVYPWHCDHMGHMNVMWYAGKFDEATWNLLSQVGITSTYLKQEGRGMVAVEQQTFYKRELFAGMTICINSKISEVKDKSVKFVHEMINNETNEIVAITYVTGLHIDSKSRRPCALPDNVMRIFFSGISECSTRPDCVQ